MSELDAFKLRSPLQSINQSIGKPTCVCLYEDFVFIGHDSGVVASYSIETRRSNNQSSNQSDQKWNSVTNKKIGGFKPNSPIKQIMIINPSSSYAKSSNQSNIQSADFPLLFVLSEDGRLRGLQQHTLDCLIDFQSIKEINQFSLNLSNPNQVCISVKLKRKLLIYSITSVGADNKTVSQSINQIDPSKNKLDLTRDVGLIDLPLNFALKSETVIVGFKNKYQLINVSNNQITEIPVPIDGNPCMLITGESELLLASNNQLAIFVDFNGNVLPRNPIFFNGSPSRIEHCENYILGLFSEQPANPPATQSATQATIQAMVQSQFISVRIASLIDGRVVQTVPLPNPINCSSDQSKFILLTSSGDVFSMNLVSTEDQIAQYLELSQNDEAYTLFKSTNPSTEQLIAFHENVGWILLKDLLTQPAFHHFIQSTIDPRELIGLFEDLVTLDPTYQRKSQGSFDHLIEKGRKKAETRTEDKRFKAIVGMSTRAINRTARLMLAHYLWAYKQMINQSNNQTDQSIDYTLAAAIDTALLMLYVEFTHDKEIQWPTTSNNQSTNQTSNQPISLAQFSTTTFPFTLQQLLSPANQSNTNNHILVSAAERYLLIKHSYYVLARFYQSINEPSKALEVWHKLGTGEYVENQSINQTIYQSIYGTGQSPAISPKHSESNQTINQPNIGLIQTVKTLQSLGDSPLLWEFAQWVLLMDSEQGLSIFTNNKQPINHEKVLQYLRKVVASRPDSPRNSQSQFQRNIVEVYLEHIVLGGQSTDPVYHTQLAQQYIKQIYELQVINLSKSSRPVPGNEQAPLGPLRAKLLRFFQSSRFYDVEAVLTELLSLVYPEFTQSNKQSFDDTTKQWLPEPSVLFNQPNGMIEEMIILSQKLNHNFDCLNLFVFGLRDFIGAANFCLIVKRNVEVVAEQERRVRIERENRINAKTRSAARHEDQVKQEQAAGVNPFQSNDHSEDSDDDELDLIEARYQHDDLFELDDKPHPGDVFLSLADIYFSDDFFQLFSTPAELAVAPGSTPPASVYRVAVDLLSRYHMHIDPVKVTRIIPEYVPLPALQSLFQRMVGRTLHERRHAQVVKMLAKTRHLSGQIHAMNQQSKYFLMDDEEKCVHCQKPINDSFFTAISVEQHQPDYERGILPEIPFLDEEELSPRSPPVCKPGVKMGRRHLLLHQACLQIYQVRHNRNKSTGK